MANRIVPSARATDRAPREGAALELELLEILGPPPLFEGENQDNYNGLYDRFRSALAPADVIEELWARDVVDLVWEVLRLRRLKAKLMDAASSRGLAMILDDFGMDYFERDELVGSWARREKTAVKEVNELLKRAGHDQETIAVQTLSAKLNDIERFDRMIMQAEGRRNAVLREIDRHRDAVARRLREAVTDIEDAEFEEITASGDKAAA